jgi:hypothetical protein
MKFYTDGETPDQHISVKSMFGVTDLPANDGEKAQVRIRLQELEMEHHDLDDVIYRLAADPAQDQLQLRRLKKRKLVLKDQIARLRALLIPNIIA